MSDHLKKTSSSSKPSSTGAGAEAAVGMDAISGQRGSEPTKSRPGAVKAPDKTHAADKIQHPGSEPIEGRTTEHESGYGGKGAEPRVSSEQRESVEQDGSVRDEH